MDIPRDVSQLLEVELEQDAYGSAILPLPDELSRHGSATNERFDVEVEDGTIIFKRLEAGYDIDQ